MISTMRLYVDATYALSVMAVVGIIFGFAAAGVTGDTQRGLQVAVAMFVVAGALLIFRLWRITRKGNRQPADPT